jgi:hypothetical protein
LEKERCKANGFRWDPLKKIWWKNIALSEMEESRQWVKDQIMDGVGTPVVEEIPFYDKYKTF